MNMLQIMMMQSQENERGGSKVFAGKRFNVVINSGCGTRERGSQHENPLFWFIATLDSQSSNPTFKVNLANHKDTATLPGSHPVDLKNSSNKEKSTQKIGLQGHHG